MGAFGGKETNRRRVDTASYWVLQHHGYLSNVPREAPTLRHNASGCPVLSSVPLTRASVPTRHSSYTAQVGIPRPHQRLKQDTVAVDAPFTRRPSHVSAREKKLGGITLDFQLVLDRAGIF